MFVWLSPTAAVEFRRGPGARTTHLRFGRAGIAADVSIQPGAVITTIDDQARSVGADPNRWRLTVLHALGEWATDLAWFAPVPTRLAHGIGAFTHPLLATIYTEADDCTALTEIPRWASPTLRTNTASEAGRALTAGRGNRRLTRTLAASLTPRDGTIDLAGLGLAAAAVGLVSTDELCNIIESADTGNTTRSAPSDEAVRALRGGLALYPPARRAALLLDIGRRGNHADAATAMLRLGWIIDRAPRPLPTRLTELTAMCDRLVPIVNATERPVTRRRAAPLAASSIAATTPSNPPPDFAGPPAQTTLSLEAEPHTAPPPPQRAARGHSRRIGATARVAPSAPETHPATWPIPQALVGIAHHSQSGLDFDVPTSTAALRQWGAQLRNCLDTFAAAVAHQRSWLIGIRRGDVLIGCIEICPHSRRIRQALGPRNNRLADDVYDTAYLALSTHGLLRAR